MRAVIILAGATLTLTACGNNDQSDNTANIDENLTAANIVSNDVTAIDAVTGDAANMAADVNYENEVDTSLDNGANMTPAASKPEKRSEKPQASADDTGARPTNTSDNTAE